MRRILITFLCLMMLAKQAWGFALLGPLTVSGTDDSWETPVIGYALPDDLGTPKQYGQGYRRNLPVMYYGYNENFAGFFGLQGEQAIDQSFAILNNTFTNNSSLGLDGYSTNLVEFSFDSQTINDTAEELGLTDLKSVNLFMMMEQLGLAEPERYIWTLHDRYLPPGGKCPFDELYLVVQRNYGIVPSPVTAVQYSPYVNNTLYTYQIEEACTGPDPLALAVPGAVDPFANTYTAVAGLGDGLGISVYTTNAFGFPTYPVPAFESGGEYTGLTVDDVGGLRYLLSTNNIAYEDISGGSLLEYTNTSSLQLLITGNLYSFMQFAQSNPPAALLAQYPGLVINSVSNYFVLVTNYNVYSYFTNYYGSPSGTPPYFVVGTNGYTLSFQTNYAYTFGNLVTLDYYSNTPAQLVTMTPQRLNGTPYDVYDYVTNVSIQNIVLSNVVSGDFYIVPTNSCGFDFVVTYYTNYFAGSLTNFISSATNNVSTNAAGFVASQSIIVNYTNNAFGYFPCDLVTPGPADYRGIGHIQFIRIPDTDIDPLTGNLLTPYTNTYQMVWFNPTNSQTGTQTFQRLVTTPDFLISAADQAAPQGPQPAYNIDTRNVNFDSTEELPGLAGPGTIIPPTTITYNSVGDLFGNGSIAENFVNTNGYLSQQTQAGLLQWASFDGTTNPPILYPNGTSIQELENNLVISVTPTTLPAGTNNVTYPTTTFTASGGQPPFTWSLDGTQLPEGLAFFNGVLSGTPVGNAPGTYDFTIEATDQSNRSVYLNYSITIY